MQPANQPNAPLDPLEPDVHLPGDEFWEAHKGKIFAGIGLVLVASLAIITWFSWSANRKREAMAEFAAASTPDEWREIMRKYPTEPIAGNSALLLAAFLREAGQREEAKAEYEALLSARGNYALRPAAALGLAELVASTPGAVPDQVAKAFQQAAAEFPNSYIAPFARFSAAEELSRAELKDQAAAAFRAIVAEFPQSSIARMASMQVQRLAPAPAQGGGISISPEGASSTQEAPSTEKPAPQAP
jgi:tetratricopeptide (TPR) repeat protein